MNLQGLGKVETFQTYLDMAFKNGVAATIRTREETANPDKIFRSRRIEMARVEVIAKSLTSNLDRLLKSFPKFDELDPFYQELVRCTVDYDLLKQSLGALLWAKKQIYFLYEKHHSDLQKTTRMPLINKTRTAFSGRVSSVMRQIKKNLEYLEEVRKILKGFPTLKTKIPTIVIAGMPNVGKSTLLSALTGSKPEIASYPFTTKRINLGYDDNGYQYVDTPGLLDRPLSDRNPIEKQAILALKHLAKAIIFVFDPTESCGYPLKDQKHLLGEVKRLFGIPVISVANKSDTGTMMKETISISAKENKGINEVKTEIRKLVKEE